MFNPSKPKLRYQLMFEGRGRRRSRSSGRAGSPPETNSVRSSSGNLPEKPPEFKVEPKSERQAPNVWPVRRLDGHTNEISRLVATPDGKHLASASFDRTVRVWPTDATAAGKAEVVLDEDTRKREARRVGKKEPANDPGVSVETQTACTVLEGHKEWVYTLGVSGDGKRLVSGDAASNVIVWDADTRKQVAKWTGHSWNWVVAASLSPDGKTALVSENRYKRDDFDVPVPALKLLGRDDRQGNARPAESAVPETQHRRPYLRRVADVAEVRRRRADRHRVLARRQVDRRRPGR